MKSDMKRLVALCLVVPLATACERVVPADTVLRNGAIYTVSEQRDWVEAVAIRDGVFVAVGSNAEMDHLVGDDTRVIDLERRMAMPGIYDQHVHPIDAGLQALYECQFPPALTPEDIADAVRDCAEEVEEGTWIRGGQWGTELLESDNQPHRSLLDAAVPDHPVYLYDVAVHSAWVNSKALELLSINENTPDPEGGVILRDEIGEPTGVLLENAAYNALDRLPGRSKTQYREAALWSVQRLAESGVIGIKDALSGKHALTAYSELDKDGALNIRVATSLAWKVTGYGGTFEDQKALIAERNRYQSDRVDPRFIKISVDGIPIGKTSAFLDPYLPDDQHGTDFRGELLIDAEQLKQDLILLDGQGLSVMMHAAGDAAARAALDAIEAARRANDSSEVLHQVAHSSYLHPDDYDRYTSLNAIADFSPVLWHPGPFTPAFDAALGEERARRIFPIKSLTDADALGVYGSDWPVVPAPNPWPGFEAMVTRVDPWDEFPGSLWPEQAIDVATAIQIFTWNGARAMRVDERAGNIQVGKSADLIVLDRNLFEVSPDLLGETKVLMTMVEGYLVYAAGPYHDVGR